MGIRTIGIIAASSVLLWSASAQRDDTRAQSAPAATVVLCYDRARDVVSRELASVCHGIVVDEAEAAAVKARRDQAVARNLGDPAHAATSEKRLASIGTAFYVDEIGRLVTNYHVIEECGSVLIRRDGQAKGDAKVLAVDTQRDLALLQGSDPSAAFAWFRSGGDNDLGRSVVVVGFPDQGMPTLVPVATPGTLLRANDGLGHIIIGADVHHGNSGSPILDSGGLVIGIVNAKLNIARVFAQTGKQAESTGIGIASAAVVDFLRRTATTFHVRNPYADRDAGHILELARPFVARVECWR